MRCEIRRLSLVGSLIRSNISSSQCWSRRRKPEMSGMVHFRMPDGSYVFSHLSSRSWRRYMIPPSIYHLREMEGGLGRNGSALAKESHSSVVAYIGEGGLCYIAEQIKYLLDCQKDRMRRKSTEEQNLHIVIGVHRTEYTGFEGNGDIAIQKLLSKPHRGTFTCSNSIPIHISPRKVATHYCHRTPPTSRISLDK